MQAPLHLMLLFCIRLHPSMLIFNVSRRSFLWQRAHWCRAWRLSLGNCDHTLELQKAFCDAPPPPPSVLHLPALGAHSAYSCIITSKRLQKSLEYCHCWGHFPRPWVTKVYIPVQLPWPRFHKHSTTCLTHTEPKAHTLTHTQNHCP